MLHIVEAGLRSTVQDDPRAAGARLGLPGAGPADPIAFAAARSLVGERSGAAIEIVGLPFTFRCDDRRLVAVTGRDVSVRAASRLPGWLAFVVRGGETATVIGNARYAYLAVAGGLVLEPVLGSRATYLPARVGPLPRALEAGDALPLGDARGLERAGKQLRPPTYGGAIAAIAGPHLAGFVDGAERAFFGDEFTVAAESDRMGVRLTGPELRWPGSDLLTCGVVPGAVQVPRGGSPIVLGPDAQTTGGYPVIAVVASASRGQVAQALPGERLRFVPVDPARAAEDLRALGAEIAAA